MVDLHLLYQDFFAADAAGRELTLDALGNLDALEFATVAWPGGLYQRIERVFPTGRQGALPYEPVPFYYDRTSGQAILQAPDGDRLYDPRGFRNAADLVQRMLSEYLLSSLW